MERTSNARRLQREKRTRMRTAWDESASKWNSHETGEERREEKDKISKNARERRMGKTKSTKNKDRWGKRRRINKDWVFRVSGRYGAKQRGRRAEEKHSGSQEERETEWERNKRGRRESRRETRENCKREGGCRDERENEGGETVWERASKVPNR